MASLRIKYLGLYLTKQVKKNMWNLPNIIEKKEDLNEWKNSKGHGRHSIIISEIPLKQIYRIMSISIEISVEFLVEINNLMLKFIYITKDQK